MKTVDLYQEILVCYDVRNNKTRNHLVEALKDVGLYGVQESVFWGYATPAERRSILVLFSELLDRETDRAFMIPVGLRKKITDGCGFGYEVERDFPAYYDYTTL